jgi:Zn-dependent protease
MFGTDLSFEFRLFGIPVRVSLFFVIMALLLGRGSVKGPVMMALWVVIVFVSVLLHELGHAFTARAFGQQPFIALHAMGGLTTWRVRQPLTAARRLATALAGPAAGIALGVFALVLGIAFPRGTTARDLLALTAVVNLAWGVLNLIPMLPLDGGNIIASLFEILAPGRGRRTANYVSVGTAVIAGAIAIMSGMFVLALICAFAVWMNIQELRAPAAPSPVAATAVIDVPAEALPPDAPPPKPPATLPPDDRS